MAQIAVTALTREEILNKAPSVFAEKPSTKTSSKYAFIPTTKIIDDLGREGWVPVSVRESLVRDEKKEGYQKHMVRFRHPGVTFGPTTLSVGDIIPEIVVTNSHDALSAFHLNAGIYRLVCSNGLLVAESTINSVSIKHVGYASSDAQEAGQLLFKELPLLTDKVSSMRGTHLHYEEAAAMAKSAAMLRWPVDATHALPFDSVELLKSHRRCDDDTNLWNIFNRIQENLLRGGIRYRTASNKKQRTRQVNSINEDIRLNKALWALAESMLLLRGIHA